MSEGLITVIVGLTSGAGGIVLSRILPSKDKQIEDAIKLRQELYQISTDLRREMRTIEKELDRWKEKYYSLLEDYEKQRVVNLENEKKIEGLKRRIGNLNKDIESMKCKE